MTGRSRFLLAALAIALASFGCGGGRTLPTNPPPAAPVPSLSSLLPAAISAGALPFAMSVTGADFETNSVVLWNGSPRPTRYVNSGQLVADIYASDVSDATTVSVTVRSLSGISNGRTFDVRSAVAGVLGVINVDSDGSLLAPWVVTPVSSSTSRMDRTFGISASDRYVGFRSEVDAMLRDTCLGAAGACSPTTIRLKMQDPNHTSIFGMSSDGRYAAVSAPGFSIFFNMAIVDTCFGQDAGCSPHSYPLSETGSTSFMRVSDTARHIALLPFTSIGGVGPIEGPVLAMDTCVGSDASCKLSTRAVRAGLTTTPAANTVEISGNGRYIAYTDGTQWPGYAPSHVFLADSCFNGPADCQSKSIPVSVAPDGTVTTGTNPAVSADGRFVAFESGSGPLGIPLSTPQQVWLRDTCLGTAPGCTPQNILVSATIGAVVSFAGASRWPSISANGRYVAFASEAKDLIIGDSNDVEDVFVRDTCAGTAPAPCIPRTIRVSVNASGEQANAAASSPQISRDGRLVTFSSSATNLVASSVAGTNVYLARVAFP